MTNIQIFLTNTTNTKVKYYNKWSDNRNSHKHVEDVMHINVFKIWKELVSYKKQGPFTLREQLDSPPVLGGDRFIFLCCVVFLFIVFGFFFLSSYCVFCVQCVWFLCIVHLEILNGFLWRLFKLCVQCHTYDDLSNEWHLMDN